MAKFNKIKKEKKVNPYASLLLVIIIALCAMGIIPILLDDQYVEFFDQVSASIGEQYDGFNKSFVEFEKVVDKFNQSLDKLEDSFVSKEDWADSEVFVSKIQEIEKIEKDVFDPLTNEALGLSYLDYFNYEKDGKLAYEIFASLKENTEFKLRRAITVSDMEKIVEDYRAAVLSIKTNVQILTEGLTKLETGKFAPTTSNINTYLNVKAIFNTIRQEIFDDEEYNVLKAHINTEIPDTFKQLALEDFISKVSALPDNMKLLYDTASVENATKAKDKLTNSDYVFFTKEELAALDNQEYHDSVAKLELAVARAELVKEMKGNKMTEGSAEYINEQINRKKLVQIDASSYVWIQELLDMVKDWEEKYDVVTDENDPNYCEQIYNLISKRSQLQDYIKSYNDFIRKQ